MDHLQELQGRLFSIVIAFVLMAGVAYPFFGKIAGVLLAPLSKDQQLVYLTPGGAFSFIIKVCVYVGIVGALPVIIFHLYRFIMPAVRRTHLRSALKFTIASLFLAVCGIIFAYFVSLPASLYFLTGFNLYHINPMLTIDSYFSFVMTYLLAGALLFQLPLIMLIINSVKPLTPKKLMNYQRHMIVGSFVIAAVISPTPDALNQILLASPMVVMYQLGIVMIWATHRKRTKAAKRAREAEIVKKKMAAREQQVQQYLHETLPAPVVTIQTQPPNPIAQPVPSVVPVQSVQCVAANASPRSIDGMRATSSHRPIGAPRRTQPQVASIVVKRQRPSQAMFTVPGRTIDGIIIPKRV